MVISLSQLLFLLIENVLSLFIKQNDNIVYHSIPKVYLGVPVCLKFMTLSFGCLLNYKYITMEVELSLSSHNTLKNEKKGQHNLTEIGKSMKVNEKCHFFVRVSRVQC